LDERREGKGRESPEQFTKEMPEGEGGGPGAPETVEPTQGRPSADGRGAEGDPGGPAMKGLKDHQD
jgi:hypothetical protein